MAAIAAGRTGARVILLERTRDGGRKILISGGGRCNVLPSSLEPGLFVTDSSRHTMRRLLLAFPLEEQRKFFERDLAIPLALEPETGKLFPVSNRARDVRDGLVAAARRAGASISFGCRVVTLEAVPQGWRLATAEGETILAGAVILATGGLSVPTTGSDGDGLGVARALGHTLHDTYPALTPLTAEPPVHGGLAGVSLTVTLKAKEARFSTRGGFLFTHRGYSGPAVLDISHLAVRSRMRSESREAILVQWCSREESDWNEELQRRGAATVGSTLRAELPARLAELLIAEAGLSPVVPLAQLRREERLRLVQLLVRYPLPWTADEGYRKAEVTGGGVALSEVNPGTLESRRCPGLFLCGEMLDAFGPIGGYNFAWAWATGRTAGRAAGLAQTQNGRPEGRPL